MSYIHDTLYGVGIDVWHKVSHLKGMILSITIKPYGSLYEVVWDNMIDSFHYDIELTTEDLSHMNIPNQD